MFEFYNCVAMWGDVELTYQLEARSPREARQLFEEVRAGNDRLVRLERKHDGQWIEVRG
jgi:hypothetical protein